MSKFASKIKHHVPAITDLNASHSLVIDTDTMPFNRYEIVDELASGGYGVVFKGVDRVTKQQVAIKIIKQSKINEFIHEVNILRTVQSDYSIKLERACYSIETKKFWIIFPLIANTQIVEFPRFSLKRARGYLRHVLKGLNIAHNQGIMHRDIKPKNILYNKQSQKAIIIDWGIADKWKESQQYSDAGSLYYKAPEILLGCKSYNFAVDIWSLGCIFGGIIFNINELFKGSNNINQATKIAEFLGTDQMLQFIKSRTDVDSNSEVQKALKKTKFEAMTVKDLAIKFNSTKQGDKFNNALDLLQKMLVLDPASRITAEQALLHKFLQD